MKTAFAKWNQNISPVFDVCGRVLVVETNIKGGIVGQEEMPLPMEHPLEKVRALAQSGVGCLVCGAISQSLRRAARDQGIQTLAFVTGPVDRVREAFFAGRLPAPEYSMPGCPDHQK